MPDADSYDGHDIVNSTPLASRRGQAHLADELGRALSTGRPLTTPRRSGASECLRGDGAQSDPRWTHRHQMSQASSDNDGRRCCRRGLCRRHAKRYAAWRSTAWRTFGVALGLGEVAADNVAATADANLLGLQFGVAPSAARDDERHARGWIVQHNLLHLLGRALTHTQDIFEAAFFEAGDGLCTDHAAIGHHADPADSEALAQTRVLSLSMQTTSMRSLLNPAKARISPRSFIGSLYHSHKMRPLRSRGCSRATRSGCADPLGKAGRSAPSRAAVLSLT